MKIPSFIIPKTYIEIGNIKTIYFVFALIALSVLGYFSVIPQYIPSWEILPEIFVAIVYVLNLVLLYFIIRRSQKYFFSRFTKTQGILLTISTSSFLVFAIISFFIVTSLNFGQGFMGATYLKEFNYPKQHTTVYLYDAGFLDPATAIKIRSGFLPLMKDIKLIPGWIPYGVKVSQSDEIVQIVYLSDTLRVDLKTAELIGK